MQRSARLIACALTVVGASAAVAKESLPPTLRYTFFISGRPAGAAEIHLKRTKSALVFESTSRVEVNGELIELACRTDADPTTFEVRTFSCKGTKAGIPVACELHVSADSVYGTMLSRGQDIPKKRDVRGRKVVVFEDWVVEMQILLALRQELAERHSTTYWFVFATSFMPADALAGYTGEVLVEAPGRSLTARKLAVGVQGGPPFESHIDSRGVPVYLNFPGVEAEMFLNEFFGDNPPTRYHPTTTPPVESPAGGGRGNN